MDKLELKEKIKTIVKQIYSKKDKLDLDNPSIVSLDNVRFPVLVKFPKLLSVIKDLLTQQYDLFLKDIQWVAPRPTTFRIILANDKDFYIIYTERTWIAKIEGKKYYLLNISEEERAAESIARILSYGSNELKKEEPENSSEETPETTNDENSPEEETTEET